MENEFVDFTRFISEQTDEELIRIVTADRDSYHPLAVEAAKSEIKERGIKRNKFYEIKNKAVLEKEVDSFVVSSKIRFLNYVIDQFVWLVFFGIFIFIIFQFIKPTYPLMSIILSYFGTYIAYYSIMEIIFQKTVGKFFTKTKVVKINGEKPRNRTIIARSFYRLIPFDAFVFLFVRNGIHDSWSKTKVVNDSIE
jgi:uncharacterized RDD family membrane protein YckC